MGGNGAYYGGKSSAFETRQYSSIGVTNGIKVIVAKTNTWSKKRTLPMHSNTAKVYALSFNNKIVKIGFYENNNLVKSIDLDDSKRGYHSHDWELKNSKKYGRKIPIKISGKHNRLTDTDFEILNSLGVEIK